MMRLAAKIAAATKKNITPMRVEKMDRFDVPEDRRRDVTLIQPAGKSLVEMAGAIELVHGYRFDRKLFLFSGAADVFEEERERSFNIACDARSLSSMELKRDYEDQELADPLVMAISESLYRVTNRESLFYFTSQDRLTDQGGKALQHWIECKVFQNNFIPAPTIYGQSDYISAVASNEKEVIGTNHIYITGDRTGNTYEPRIVAAFSGKSK